MQLFKRMMLSLFPEEMVNNPMNPASMFVGLISAKQYFSVITRKIVENYKLNLFDVSLDSFEVKTGFGEAPTLKVKNLDFYYGYAAVANLNGYKSYAPGQMAHVVALFASTHCEAMSEKYDEQFTVQFIYTVYLMTFVFQARIKQFPFSFTEKDGVKNNFNWFIELFFSLHEFLLQQSGKKLTQKNIDIMGQYKKDMMKDHIQLFFMLLYFYRYAAQSIDDGRMSSKEFFSWLLYDELKEGELQALAKDFVDHSSNSVYITKFSITEKNLLHLVFPAEILVRFIFDGKNTAVTIRHFVSPFFPKAKTTSYMNSFLENGDSIFSFLEEISDYTNFKSTYFTALKKYITHLFQKQDSYNVLESKEIDEWMSAINAGGPVDMASIPARLKQESEIMERLMNFYITYIGGYWLGRGDSWYIRSLYPDLLTTILVRFKPQTKYEQSYYTGVLFNYSKNVYYYKYAFQNIRAGKEKFHLPLQAELNEIYSGDAITHLITANAVVVLLQDIVPKDVKLYTQNPKILTAFGDLLQKSIGKAVRKAHTSLFQEAYAAYEFFIPGVSEILAKHTKQEHASILKENAYTLDFWLFRSFLNECEKDKELREMYYGGGALAAIFAMVRETLLGFMLYLRYIAHQKAKDSKRGKEVRLGEPAWGQTHVEIQEAFLQFYGEEVLTLTDRYLPRLRQIIASLHTTYGELLDLIGELDDNPKYMALAWENTKAVCGDTPPSEAFEAFLGEDIVRFTGFLKTMSYYNKRYIMPNP